MHSNFPSPEQCWPLFGLSVRTPRLELRHPTDDDCYRLLGVIDAGVHDPAFMPFSGGWTDTPQPQRWHDSLQFWWGQRANWRVDEWSLTCAVFLDGEPIGVQDLNARQFPTLRVVVTGSWLGQRWQGQGFGREMREAILHLAFAGLGALEAHTEAFADNAASLGVTRACGYAPNGHMVASTWRHRSVARTCSVGSSNEPAGVAIVRSVRCGW